MTLGIIGEYLGRLFEENKQRPLYLIDKYQPPTTKQVTDKLDPHIRKDDSI